MEAVQDARTVKGDASNVIRLKDCDPNFAKEVIAAGGKNLAVCFQCGTCSGGCPTTYKADYTPRQIIRMVAFGMRREVLNSDMIWLCSSCYTCTTRCPRGVEITHIMAALKSIAIKEGIKPKNPMAPAFYKTFTEITEHNGRIHETSLVLKMNFRSQPLTEAAKCLLRDAPLGLSMFSKGKLELLPPRVMKLEDVRKIFNNVRKLEAAK